MHCSTTSLAEPNPPTTTRLPSRSSGSGWHTGLVTYSIRGVGLVPEEPPGTSLGPDSYSIHLIARNQGCLQTTRLAPVLQPYYNLVTTRASPFFINVQKIVQRSRPPLVGPVRISKLHKSLYIV